MRNEMRLQNQSFGCLPQASKQKKVATFRRSFKIQTTGAMSSTPTANHRRMTAARRPLNLRRGHQITVTSGAAAAGAESPMLR